MEQTCMVSIIVVNYNTYKLTSECIRSVFEKTKEVGFEVILVDNASVEVPAEKFLEEFPGITLIKNMENVGFAKGNNEGLMKAKGKYILLLNSDTKLVNDAVSIAAKKIASDPQIGVLSGKLIYPNGENQPVAGRFPNLITELRELFRLNKGLSRFQRRDLFLGNEFDHDSEIEADWVWGAFFMFPKDALNYFPENKLPDDYFMYGEDMQWCFKFRKLGFKILYSPEPVAIHYIGASSKGNGSEWESFKNKMLPNVASIIKKEKGFLYKSLYFLVKALHHLTLRNTKDLSKAIVYLNYIYK